MPYLITMCVVFVIIGIAYNVLKKLELIKPPMDGVDLVAHWCLIAFCAAVWPVTAVVGVLAILILVGNKFTDKITNLILKLFKGKKDAS